MSSSKTTSATAASTLGKRTLDSKGSSVLTIPIVLSKSYHADNFVSLHSVHSDISIPLNKSGSGVITTSPVVIGTLSPCLDHFDNPNLVASLTVWYKYDKSSNELTLCSHNLVSEDSTYLTTYPQAAPDQAAKQYTYKTDRSPCNQNGCWNYTTNSTPGLQKLFQQIVCDAKQAILDAAPHHVTTLNVRDPIPQDFSNAWLVYQDGNLQGFHSTGMPLLPGNKLVHVSSVDNGFVDWPKDKEFSNVIDSKDDPKVPNPAGGVYTWIALYTAKNGGVAPTGCASKDTAFNPASGAAVDPVYKCAPEDGDPVGGHCIVGRAPSAMPGNSDDVFIVPICSGHNGKKGSIFMKTTSVVKVMKLKKYFK